MSHEIWRRWLRLGMILMLLTPLVATAQTAGTPAGEDIDRYQPQQTTLTFAAGAGAPAGDLRDGHVLLTPETSAERPFTDLLLRWEATYPISSHLHIELRASADGRSWTDWGEVEESDDLYDYLRPQTHWGSPIYAGSLSRLWQVRVTFEQGLDGSVPELRSLTVSTVDVGETPEAQRPVKPAMDVAGVSRPPVFFRTDWGSPDGEGSRNPPDYYRANHMVVHHTADANSLGPGQSWWGDRVRAIWSFHTYDRGWGDIGYNFLVAPDGSIYEGRAGAYPSFTSDPVAFHDTGNYGSMGVAMIGTYSSVLPTAAAQDSLVRILAWKADQRGIDPLASSYYYGCDISRYCGNPGAITPNLAGHRDVANKPTGYTSCPGGQLHTLLPTIRSRVSALLGGQAGENGDNVIDNLEQSLGGGSGFISTLSNGGSWNSSPCGDGGSTYWTYTTDQLAESTNKGRWRKVGLGAGSFRIFARLPKGCNVGTPTALARYSIWQGGQRLLEVTRSQDTPAEVEWIEITSAPLALADMPVEVHLADYPGEPLAQGRVIYFDSVRFVKEVPTTSVALESVTYDRTTLMSGELLSVSFKVKNTSSSPVVLQTQEPQPGVPGQPSSGYVYDESECFLGNVSQSYPAFPKETGSFRVMLGMSEYSGGCSGGTGGYPWRWGVSADPDAPDSLTLSPQGQPGDSATVVGYVRFRNDSASDRVVTLRAGLVDEYVRYVSTDVAVQSITITPERRMPLSVMYHTNLQPQAHVYRLKATPDLFLGRTTNPLSIIAESYIGSYPWAGEYQNWGSAGPLGQKDQFMLLATRQFEAPVAGSYTFELASDDGAWLWIDGALVVETHGLHPEQVLTGTMTLSAGQHVLALKYFERGGTASLGYRWQPPGQPGLTTIPTSIGGASHDGALVGAGSFSIVSDDLGGSGVSAIKWSFDGTTWQTSPGSIKIFSTHDLAGGAYTLRYQAIDALGNTEYVRSVTFELDPVAPTSSLLSSVRPDGVIMLTAQGSDYQSGVRELTLEISDLGPAPLAATRTYRVQHGVSVAFFGTPGHTYAARTRALDRAGNLEPYHTSPDVSSLNVPADATFTHIYFPSVRR